MDIKSLIGYINRDIRDIGELTASFSGYDKIPQFDMDLTLSKIKTIAEELEMLEKLNSGIAVSVNKQVVNEKEEVKSNTVPPEQSKIHNVQVKSANSTLTVTNQMTTKQFEVMVNEEPQPEVLPELEKEISKQLTETLKNKKKSPPVENVEVVLQATDIKDVIKENKEKPEDKHKKEEIPAKKPLGDRLKNEKRSLIDVISENIPENGIKLKLKSNPISDIRTAISLNDKIWFVKELFDGDTNSMNIAIDKLNTLDSFEKAMEYINANFSWDIDNVPASKFISLIERRYL
ncbi:MAG: hypothetical protein NTW49_02400 [Bacteroidia bacterium]|nr:hypothetical protein [Bacteroidia bacterium]